jgi:hypothetical protein
VISSKIVFLDGAGLVDSAGDDYFRAGGAAKAGTAVRPPPRRRPAKVFGLWARRC